MLYQKEKCMKIKTLAVITMSVLSLGSLAANAATVSVQGGDVHFRGSVVNAACAVSADTINQTVQMGQVRAADLSAKGDVSDAKDFQIKLLDCDTSVASTAAFAFSGVAIDSANPTVLALQGSAAGAAKNVGVQILDYRKQALNLDGATFSSASTLINGTNVIPFQARYYATGAAAAGTADADATFKIQYQ